MSRRDEPILARRPSSDLSREREAAEEEDALLSGKKIDITHTPKWRVWTEIGLAFWAVLATIVVIVLAVLYEQSHEPDLLRSSPNGKRNLIFMVSDGMGPTSLSLTRSYRQLVHGLPPDDTLVLDSYVVGQSRTRSTSSLITDSAAGATAFSCGKKSYNGAISTLPDSTPCGTVMEAAKRAGYMTGLVVTTRITDATPACFAAHVHKRDEEDRIAEQLLGDYPLGQTVDLMLGAGRCHFLPNSTRGSCRGDDKDMVAYAKNKGFSYVSSRKDFEALHGGGSVDLPLLGLFADHDIPYEVDREHHDAWFPSLQEMTKTALKALEAATRDSDQGFFLMVEGSRIDHAGHANDPVAQVHEVLAYDHAFATVLQFLERSNTNGILIATSDHETGGLSTARQLHPFVYPQYAWFPGVLANASRSAEWLSHEFAHWWQTHPDSNKADMEAFLTDIIETGLGVRDLDQAELDQFTENPIYAPYFFADVVSRRAQTGWSTHGHSAADVNIYASDPKLARTKLQGSHENTEVGEFLAWYLDVDTDVITKELNKKGVGPNSEEAFAWMGPRAQHGERLDGQDHVSHYEHDFKLGKRCGLCGS